MTKPPYPTECVRVIGTQLIFPEHRDQIYHSVLYWLTPRKCSEVPPEFPCLAWDTDFKEWFSVMNATLPNIFVERFSHWLPLPPAPEES